MEIKVNSDMLFLAWNCNKCTRIKLRLGDSIFNNDIGEHGQILTAVHTFSNDGTRYLLDVFNLNDYVAPVLLTYDGKIIDDMNEIIRYLVQEKFAKEFE